MSIGTGIFLSTLTLAAIALVISTRDRLRWGRLLAWTGGGAIVLGGVLAAGLYGITQYNARPQRMIELWGLSLGMPAADVRFLKGEPTHKDEHAWVYSPATGITYTVGLQNGNVRFIAFQGDRSRAPTVAGIGGYSDLASLLSRLGAPTDVSESQDGLSRIYSFDSYAAVFGITKNEIFLSGIYDPKLGPLRFAE